jgi:hypothetical protein
MAGPHLLDFSPMCSRVLALVLSVVFLLSGVFTAGPAIAAADSHAVAVLAAAGHATDAPAPGDLPDGDVADHDQADSLLDVPDQLAGRMGAGGGALQAYRPDPGRTASLTHPHLAGPQRPPRAISHCA